MESSYREMMRREVTNESESRRRRKQGGARRMTDATMRQNGELAKQRDASASGKYARLQSDGESGFKAARKRLEKKRYCEPAPPLRGFDCDRAAREKKVIYFAA